MEDIGATAAIQGVVILSAKEGVVAAAPFKDIVPCTASQCIAASGIASI